MKAEDLFTAIGGVETSRLERSEWEVHDQMGKYQNKTSHLRLGRNILVAALIAATLATTVFAAGYLFFDSPKQMIDTLFGRHPGQESSSWSIPNYKGEVAAEYHSDRVPVNEQAAENMEPHTQSVGQSITWAGHTLTVDASMYDAQTECGFVTYSIENPDGIRPYNVAPYGEISFPYGELMTANHHGRSYVIAEKCTDTKLCATYYYMTRDRERSKDLELTFTFWAGIADPKGFMEQSRSEDIEVSEPDADTKIVIPADTSANLKTASFGGGAVVLSPFSVRIDLTKVTPKQGEFIQELRLRMADGTEQIIMDGNTMNTVLNVGNEAFTEQTLILNRLVNLEDLAAVIVDGTTYQ